MLDALCDLLKRIRRTDDAAELASIEDEVDTILRAQMKRIAGREENASETQTLVAMAYRLDSLIHQRRLMLAACAAPEKAGYPPHPLNPG